MCLVSVPGTSQVVGSQFELLCAYQDAEKDVLILNLKLGKREPMMNLKTRLALICASRLEMVCLNTITIVIMWRRDITIVVNSWNYGFTITS
jgi:hypothetical protein